MKNVKIRARRGVRVPLYVELLESRIALDGSVLATITAGNLVITGDAGAVSIVIDQPSAGQVHIAGASGSTVNGVAEATLSGFTGGITFKMGNASDTVAMNGVTVAKGVTFSGGGGDDTLTLADCHVTGAVKADGGVGTDSFYITDTGASQLGAVTITDAYGNTTIAMAGHVSGNVSVKCGAGTSSVTTSAFTVGGSFTITGGSDYDVEELNGLDVAKGVSISNGLGMASVSLSGAVDGSVKVTNGGTAFSSVALGHMTVGGAISVTDGKSASAQVRLDTVTGAGAVKVVNGFHVTVKDSTLAKGLAMTNAVDAAVANVTNTALAGAFSLKNAGAGNLTIDQHCNFKGSLTVSDGKGDSVNTLANSDLGYDMVARKSWALKVTASGGTTRLDVDTCTIGGDLTVSGTGTANYVDVRDSGFLKGLSATATGGYGEVRLDSTEFDGKLAVTTGGGNDLVKLNAVLCDPIVGGVTINTGNGDDSAYIDSGDSSTSGTCLFTCPVSVKLGGGNDSLHLAGQDGGNLADYTSTAAFDGGDGASDRIYMVGNGNSFTKPAKISGFEVTL